MNFFNTGSTNCGICKAVIKNKNCSPNNCSCIFHRNCFSNYVNNEVDPHNIKCPRETCRKPFDIVHTRREIGGSIVKHVPVIENHPCPICCEMITRPFAMPESCNHYFCYSCLKEWSKIRHVCPLDRGSFQLILLSDSYGGPVIKRVEPPEIVKESSDEEHPELAIICEICHGDEDEDLLLLCDNCDKGYHTYCLTRPLESVPEGNWFCPECEEAGFENPDNEHRNHGSLIIDDEAVDSEHSNEADFLVGHLRDSDVELDEESQRHIHEQAIQRYRGRSAMLSVLDRLTARINEAASRSNRRRTQRRRVRDRIQRDPQLLSPSRRGRMARPGTRRRVLQRNGSLTSDNDSDDAIVAPASNQSKRRRLLDSFSDAEESDKHSLRSSAASGNPDEGDTSFRPTIEESSEEEEEEETENSSGSILGGDSSSHASPVKKPPAKRATAKRSRRKKKKAKGAKKGKKKSRKRQTSLQKCLSRTTLTAEAPDQPTSSRSTRQSRHPPTEGPGSAPADPSGSSEVRPKPQSSPQSGDLLGRLLQEQSDFLAKPKYEAPKPSTSTAPASSPSSGWTAERIAHAKGLLKSTLSRYFKEGQLDKASCRFILLRAIDKVKMKPPERVSDAKIVRLADDYVDYVKKNPTSLQQGS